MLLIDLLCCVSDFLFVQFALVLYCALFSVFLLLLVYVFVFFCLCLCMCVLCCCCCCLNVCFLFVCCFPVCFYVGSVSAFLFV